MKWGGGGLSRGRGQLVSPFVGHSWFMEKERPPGKQRWLCSKGKAAFVCQYESNWVKPAVFYKSLLCLGAVGKGISGASSRSQLPAGRQQPADALRTKLCIFSYSNSPAAEPDVELVSHSFMGPCPNPGTPLGLRGSRQGRRAASSGPRSFQGAVTGAPAWWTQGPQQPLKARVVAAALKCSPSIGEEAAAPLSCLSCAFCVALSLTRPSCAALRSGQ